MAAALALQTIVQFLSHGSTLVAHTPRPRLYWVPYGTRGNSLPPLAVSFLQGDLRPVSARSELRRRWRFIRPNLMSLFA